MANNLSILYAEDDKQIRTQYYNLLKLYVANVYAVEDGKKALEVYKKYKPQIAILDIDMPYLDGLKLAKQIRHEDENIILIMLTGYSEKDMLIQAIDLQVLKFLIKPVKIFDLENIIQKSIKMIKKDDNVLFLSGGFKWHFKKNELYNKENQIIKLTKKELTLLKLFCENKNHIFTNDDIINHIWDESYENNDYNKLRIILSKLKSKLSHNLFKSIYKLGYRLNI